MISASIQFTGFKFFQSLPAMSLVVLFLLGGCQSYYPMSNEVRAGGTIMVAVKNSTGADLLDKSTLTANFHDFNSANHDIRVRRVIRAYPGAASEFSRGISGTYNTPQYYEGIWFVVVDFVNASDGQPLVSLNPGLGTLTFNNVSGSFGVNILSGSVTASNPLLTHGPNDPLSAYAQDWLASAEPGPHVAIEVTGTPPDIVAAATFLVEIDESTFEVPDLFPVDELRINVGKATNDPFLQLTWSVSAGDAGKLDLLIMARNPYGFSTPKTYNTSIYTPPVKLLSQNNSMERDLSSIILAWSPLGTTAAPIVVNEANLIQYVRLKEATFYDTNGDEISSGMSASIELKVEDT